MGSDLVCYLALDDEVLPLYERMVEGGSRYALRADADGLPPGWILPAPWRLAYDMPRSVVFTEPVPRALDAAWHTAAGAPEDTDPLGAFTGLELQVASLLSLAAPSGIVYIEDCSFGDHHFHEYAAFCAEGRLVAASGIGRGRSFEFRDGRYQDASRAISPIAHCAGFLHSAFTAAEDHGDYLPGTAEPLPGRPVQPAATRPPRLDPRDLAAWAPVFPLLATL